MAEKTFKEPSVKVVNNHYKVSGDFSVSQRNRPIYNEKKELCGVTNPATMTHLHSYGAEAPFFEGLSKGIFRGTRCDNPKCEYKGSTYVPFRIYCPDCLKKMKVLDLTKLVQKTAKVYTFMVCERTGAFNSLDKPIKFINIEFDGVCTILMSYLSVGEPEIGMRVIPIFRTKNPTFTITDLSWVAEGTPASKLPKGFTF